MSDTSRIGNKAKIGLAAAALLLVGGAAGAGAIEATRPSIEMAPMAPVPIARLARLTGNSGPITLRGRVVEVYGNKFVLDDGSGKTLVDTGPRGDDGSLVALGTLATVQGRYDRGFVHASFLVDGSGNVTALGPIGGLPHPGPHGPPPPGGPDRGPPPPPPRDGAAPPPPSDASAAQAPQ